MLSLSQRVLWPKPILVVWYNKRALLFFTTWLDCLHYVRELFIFFQKDPSDTTYVARRGYFFPFVPMIANAFMLLSQRLPMFLLYCPNNCQKCMQQWTIDIWFPKKHAIVDHSWIQKKQMLYKTRKQNSNKKMELHNEALYDKNIFPIQQKVWMGGTPWIPSWQVRRLIPHKTRLYLVMSSIVWTSSGYKTMLTTYHCLLLAAKFTNANNWLIGPKDWLSW